MTQLRKKTSDVTKRSLNGRNQDGKIGQSDASNQNDQRYARRDENGAFAKHTRKSTNQSGQERAKPLTGESSIKLSTATSQHVPKKMTRPHKAAFSSEVFANAAEYDYSVTSVVARIQSGQVPKRQPDE